MAIIKFYRSLPLLSFTIIQISFQIVMYIFIDLKTTFPAYVASFVLMFIIAPSASNLSERYGLSDKIVVAWEEVADIVHIGIIFVYSFIASVLFLKYVLPLKKEEYVNNR